MTKLPLRKLQALFGDKLQENVRMANYTTTRVGGPASGMISVYTVDEMRRAAAAEPSAGSSAESSAPVGTGSGDDGSVVIRGVDPGPRPRRGRRPR